MYRNTLVILCLFLLQKPVPAQVGKRLSTGSLVLQQSDPVTKPSLLPQPQQVQWTKGQFPLSKCKTLVVKDTALSELALLFQKELQQKGIRAKRTDAAPGTAPVIELSIGRVEAPQYAEEAYRLEVEETRVRLTANTPHGIFNGIQTLQQLMLGGKTIDACQITDWPSFGWRGYMVDVGRNFQSMDLLKQQIDVMSRYKLNIFHFHFTEDIAWRLAIRQYPQLTAPETMLRNKGSYYSEKDLKALIAYCKERYITLVPEIDMPGHSAAFRRALHVDMQTDSGLVIIKNILKEFFETYNLPYIHIGADEVKIVNKAFLPEVINYVKSFGKKIIGWEPGGNFTNDVIRQLWMDDRGKLSADTNIQYIDSRHLYINHMDPLEAVVTIFNRKLGKKEKGDHALLGATLCLWPDRRVEQESDVLRMNPVYPGMLTFAERSWRGGGHDGWVAGIGQPGSPGAIEFDEFESRLLAHKKNYFSHLPFPYVKQTSTVWNLYGPYANEGDLSRKFEPESEGFSAEQKPPVYREEGGTIVLRHWWYPSIKGLVENAKENTTWYATTKIWSAKEGVQDFWIGFNNLSRSPATNSPPIGAWDNKQSAVWVNGKLIEPPHWQQGGQKGNSEIPLVDEGYEYRAPTKIFLQKGWNTVLVKAPVGSFKGPDWQNPVKWMFTFVRADAAGLND